MASGKKPAKPTDETADAPKEDTALSVSGEDTLVDTAEDPTADARPETFDSAEDADSITLPEPPKGGAELPEPRADDPAEDTVAPEDASEDKSTGEPEPSDSPPSDPQEQPREAAPVATTETERRGGVIPMVLGGVVAAAVGFIAAMQLPQGEDLAPRIEAQERAIADLKSAIPAPADTSALETAAQDNASAIADLSARVDALSADLEAMTGRMTELEKAPLENAVSETAMQAYEDELTRLQDAMRAQRAEVETMLANAQDMRAAADEESSQTQARAALTRILSAMDSGESYGEPLAELQATGVAVPQALIDNADSTPTLTRLRSEFPAAAREALAVTRGGGTSSVGDFFKTQLGIRSLEPKDGDDPDAILSRAEAALADGDLETALQEIETLPPEAQQALSAWVAAAETRLAATGAAQGLMAELNTN